ncbi:MAG: response regulator, partial [Candidatus Omnitrophica bacterium]|nr:response regulator [Candidatus Omnitrophota bacterium]
MMLQHQEHKPIRILLVEDNPGDARLLKEYLEESKALQFEMTHAEKLSSALSHMENAHFDVILLDLMLPDSQGLDTFTRINTQASGVPVVVMSGIADETVAIKAVHEGAEDYLVKGQVNSNLLARALRYAIERHRMKMALRSQSLVDDLTGLYNHRGFLALAGQQLKLSRRTQRGFFLVFIDLDGLKLINDYFGHLEGDQSLVNTARILKKT